MDKKLNKGAGQDDYLLNSEDFTEKRYEGILNYIKRYWRCVDVQGVNEKGPLCFIRHDVDLSVHRAAKISKIEKNAGVKSTYFLNLHSQFYNIIETDCIKKLQHIIENGHSIGLHVDYHAIQKYQIDPFHLNAIANEKKFLESVFGVHIQAISFHNPSLSMPAKSHENEIYGMINTYGEKFQKNFHYCSDSNGRWRHEEISVFLHNNIGNDIHLLIHPGWWTKFPMSPLEKVQRCINGRSENIMKRHLEILIQSKRLYTEVEK